MYNQRYGNAAMSEIQTQRKNYWNQEIVFQPNTTLNSNCFSSTSTQSQLDFHIFSTPGKKFYDLYIQFDINESSGTNAVNITPSPFFVDRIEYRSMSNDLIQTLYNINIFKNLSLLSNEQAKKILPLHGINSETWKPHPNTNIPPSQKRQYFIYLMGDIFSQNQGILADWNGYIILRLYLTGNIIENGAGNINCSQIQVKVQTTETPYKKEPRKARAYQFVDYLSYIVSTQTISSSEYRLLLQNFNGYDVEDDLYFQTSLSKTNGAYRNFLPLGFGSQIQIYNAQGQNINGGSPLQVDTLRDIYTAQHYDNFYHKMVPSVPIIYGAAGWALKKGVLDGALPQDGFNQIGITASGSPLVAPVLTGTPSAVATAGYFVIQLQSPVTGRIGSSSQLAYNATAAQIQTALELLIQQLGDDQNTNEIGVSGPITGTTIVFTFTGAQYGQDFAKNVNASTINILSFGLTNGTVNVNVPMVLTTPGNDGWNSNAVIVSCYSNILRKFCITADGNICVGTV